MLLLMDLRVLISLRSLVLQAPVGPGLRGQELKPRSRGAMPPPPPGI